MSASVSQGTPSSVVGPSLPVVSRASTGANANVRGNATVGSNIDYELFLDCVHCGLCTASCPTYAELGNENDSPRGRIYLMRAVTDGRLELTANTRRHLELCLDCRACETACPSGVQYGKLIEPFRVATRDWFHQYILFKLFPYPARMRWALWPARIAQFLRLDRLLVGSGLWRLLPPRLGRLVTLLPPLERPVEPLPAFLPAKGPRRARVALFTGCVADVMFRQTNWATARVLQENGCDVTIPAAQACCGAIHFHAGASDPARELADTNVAAFQADNFDAVIVNVAGCGSMLKDYGHHWHAEHAGPGPASLETTGLGATAVAKAAGPSPGDARQAARERFAGKVKDVHEFLAELGLVEPPGRLPVTVTYHDACHLAHAQKVREQPRKLLAKIPGLKLVELPESELCCGAAGTYNLTEPEMADRLGRRKLKNVLSTGARVVVTANAGCLLQIAREARMQGERLRIVHPIDLLDLSYRQQSLD
jgi:glycolate oxidase iron-sulfur subunit